MSARDSGMSLGTPFGIPLRLSTSWFLGAALITWLFAPSAERVLAVEPPWSWVVAASFAVLLGLSVLAHEMAHAVAALRFGLQVRSMTIHVLGGVTTMEAENRRPWVDFVIAAVGPLTSLAVAAVSLAAYHAAPGGTVFAYVAFQLTAANLIVGLFNLVPALPLDGGRLLRDVIWAASGREHVGTVVAGWTGRVFAVVVGISALLPTVLGSPDVVWLAWGMILAVFIWIEASRSLAAAKAVKTAETLTASSLMRPAVKMPHDTPLSMAEAQLPSPATAIVVTDSTGEVTGVVSPDAAAAVPVERRPWVPISAVAVSTPLPHRIAPESHGLDLINALNDRPAPVHVVEGPDGTVYGVLVTADVQASLSR
jgi:Zn-dependent protease